MSKLDTLINKKLATLREERSKDLNNVFQQVWDILKEVRGVINLIEHKNVTENKDSIMIYLDSAKDLLSSACDSLLEAALDLANIPPAVDNKKGDEK